MKMSFSFQSQLSRHSSLQIKGLFWKKKSQTEFNIHNLFQLLQIYPSSSNIQIWLETSEHVYLSLSSKDSY